MKRLLQVGIAIEREGLPCKTAWTAKVEALHFRWALSVCGRNIRGRAIGAKGAEYCFAEGDRLGVLVILETDAKTSATNMCIWCGAGTRILACLASRATVRHDSVPH